jgi:hypothetical protein
MNVMSRKCFKNNAKQLLAKLVKQGIRPGKETAYNYVKRSLELMAEGWKGSVIFDENGDIAAAAAYELFKGKVRIETLGSIGKFDGKVTPGMSVLADVMNQAQYIGNGDIILYSTPNAIDFYFQYEFKQEGPDGRRLKAKKEDYINFLEWFFSKTGGK